jgi:hypothetical protein
MDGKYITEGIDEQRRATLSNQRTCERGNA